MNKVTLGASALGLAIVACSSAAPVHHATAAKHKSSAPPAMQKVTVNCYWAVSSGPEPLAQYEHGGQQPALLTVTLDSADSGLCIILTPQASSTASGFGTMSKEPFVTTAVGAAQAQKDSRMVCGPFNLNVPGTASGTVSVYDTGSADDFSQVLAIDTCAAISGLPTSDFEQG